MRRAIPRSRRLGRAVGALAVITVVLAGCAPAPSPTPRPHPSATPTPTMSAPPTPTPTPPPALQPDGTAADNLPFFASVVAAVWATPDNVRGLAYVDALTAAGFDRAAMQVTADTTTIGEPVESLQFSVAWRDGCLVGQVGPATGDPVTAVLPLLSGGRCLIGDTASVDG